MAGKGLVKEWPRSTVNTVRYVSLLPHGTATHTLRSDSTMLQMSNRQVTGCGVLVSFNPTQKPV